jgi:hypothetical protein
VDAGVSWAVKAQAMPEWLALLRKSGVRTLRERGSWGGSEEISLEMKTRYATIKQAGFNIVAFAGTPSSVKPVFSGNQLPEDLRAVYAAGFKQGRELAELVSAWELTGEPDVGYCRDLPDRLVAYNKAMYLGLKNGAASAFQARLSKKTKWKDSMETVSGVSDLKLASSTHNVREPIVLMGALALPPGPWWERAVKNGLLDYTDAYNFHYYGNAEDLPSVIAAHRAAQRAAMRSSLSYKFKPAVRPSDRSGYRPSAVFRPPPFRSLPMWITECGLNAMVPGDFYNEERRALQAEFTISTARQALVAPAVAVFMPFILVHKGDPYAMMVAENVYPFPAWEAYAKFTRDNPWPQRKLFAAAGEKASPVVLQWLPAEGTLSHKVAGTYRVRAGQAISGEMRVYNFSDREVVGRLELKPETGKLKAEGDRRAESKVQSPESRAESGRSLEAAMVAGEARAPGAQRKAEGVKDGAQVSSFSLQDLTPGAPLRVPPGGMVSVPVVYTPEQATGYFRDRVTTRFREESGRTSQVVFGVERVPVESDFSLTPLALTRIAGQPLAVPLNKWNTEGTAQGPWRLFNGIEAKSDEPRAMSSEARSRSPESRVQSLEAGPAAGDVGRTRFIKNVTNKDPLAPPCAVAGLNGVPRDARFLKMTLDRPMNNDAFIRVDLGDENGQRFTIWENVGMVYGEGSNEVWLALEDFHPWFWSHTEPGVLRVRKDRVREIGLTFYFKSGESRVVSLEWAR